MREYFARALVRYVASWVDVSHEAWEQADARKILGHPPGGALLIHVVATRVGRWSGKVLLPLAQAIHEWAAVDQMAEEGWWG